MHSNGELPAVCLFDQVGASKSSITALQAFEQDWMMLGNVSFSGATYEDQTIVVYIYIGGTTCEDAIGLL